MVERRDREQWGSRIGFVLAAAGSAVGLGNVWRFSYVAGEQGGAAFVFIYLIAVILIGYPLMATEIAIGRKTQRNQIGAFRELAPDTPWWLVGVLGVTSGFIILSFYSVIAGWSLAYTLKSLSGFSIVQDFEAIFAGHIGSVWPPIIWHAIFMLLTLVTIGAGVVKGIQRTVKVLMPILFIILVILAGRAVTLQGAGEGIAYYLAPDLTAITAETLLAAVGQAFFTLSLGMGALITYGSYLKREENISDNSGWIVGLDIFVAILAGFAIFPAVFAFNLAPDYGPGLVFITLPAVFAAMPAGTFFGFLFFLLLSVAALTSAFSMLEVVVAWLIDEKGWDRVKASILSGIIIFLMGIPVSLGYSIFSGVTVLGLNILGVYDFLTGNILLPLGGFFTAIFAGYVWKHNNVVKEINDPPGRIRFGSMYGFLISYVIPVIILIVLVMGLINTFRS